MIFVDNIVADRKLSKTLNLLSLIRGFPTLLFLTLHAKHIALSDDDKSNLRILKSTVEFSISHKNLAGLNLSLLIIRAECTQLVLSQIARKTACPCPRTREQNHTVFLALPPLKILDQHLKIILIGRNILHTDRIAVLHFHPRKFLFQSGQINGICALCMCENLIDRIEKSSLPRKQISLLQAVHHALSKLCLNRGSLFAKSRRLIQKDYTRLRIKVVEKRHGLPAEI